MFQNNTRLTNWPSEFRSDLQVLKSNLSEAIREGDSESVKGILATYEELVTEFVETLHSLGGVFDMKTALQEISNPFDKLTELSWIEDGYYDALRESLRSDNDEILKEVILFPIRIAHMGMNRGDNLTFNISLRWLSAAFYQLSEKPLGIKKRAIAYLLRLLDETGSLYFSYFIDSTDDISEIKRFEEFAVGLLRSLNSMLHGAYEKNDFESFKEITRTIRGLFQRIQKDLAEETDESE